MQCKYCARETGPEGFPPDNKSRCKKCKAQYHREYHAARDKRQLRDDHLRRWHNISIETYEERLAEQGGKCAVCKEDGLLVVDHDHRCCPGKKSCGACYRALLCQTCNLTLGQSRESPARLQGLIDYLRIN